MFYTTRVIINSLESGGIEELNHSNSPKWTEFSIYYIIDKYKLHPFLLLCFLLFTQIQFIADCDSNITILPTGLKNLTPGARVIFVIFRGYELYF